MSDKSEAGLRKPNLCVRCRVLREVAYPTTSPDLPEIRYLPSRPGEFRPEPPTDPDVNLSIHPARATQRRLPPSIKTRSSSGCPLTPPDVGDLLPLLHGYYPASSLLRSSAPLIGASVLSTSWCVHFVPFPLTSPTRFSSSVRKPR